MVEVKEGLKFRTPANSPNYYALIGPIKEQRKKLLEIKSSKSVQIIDVNGRVLRVMLLEEVESYFRNGYWIVYQEYGD